jgi:hypothetical protein
MVTEPQPASQLGPDAHFVDPRYRALFVEIQQEWNKAEEAIKRSEQVALDVSIPAISELRYAGRRIIDALTLCASPGDNNDKIAALLEDARFCCHRAQHDAIDAALAKIAIDLNDLTKRLGIEPVSKAYPQFAEFYATFAHTRGKIVTSRAKREDRNAIYESVTTVDLPGIILSYEKIMVVRPVIKQHALRMWLGTANGVILTIAAILAMVFAGMAVDWSKWFGSKAQAHSPSAVTADEASSAKTAH